MKTLGRTRRSAFALLLIAGAAGGCATNPATGESQLSFIGEGQEIAMGQQSDPEIVAQMGLYPDEAIQQYVNQLGQRLAASSERPDLPWTFRVIDDPTVNAFAVPGGFIYITRGLMSHMTSEAQLAGVLGHEIGHVTARHSVNQMSKQQLAQIGLGIGSILSPTIAQLGNIAGAGLQVLFLKYSRDHENEADELGVRYMRRNNYEPTQLAEVMQTLERASQLQGGSGKVPEWLSSHPSPPNRVAHILQEVRDTEAEASGSGTPVVRREEYVRRLDGMLFGDNPREGFFEGSTFLHPDMRFRFDFPSGWQTVNQKAAVQGISQNQDAMISITAAQGSPSQAMNQFASQQGVQMGNARQTTINGLPAATAEFAANTEQGALHGLIAFVSHGNMTFQLIGYTPESRWGSNGNLISRSLGSFDELTDQRVLSVQPKRVDVIQLPSSMSFSTFNQRYPSVEKPEIVALINQIEGEARLSSGALYKRVVAGR
jgi:predicted Zn-dependent protease